MPDVLCTADIVHCSLSPDSIALVVNDGQMCAKLTGFEDSQICSTTDFLSHCLPATPYLAPEVQSGFYTATADLFSLGGVVYWMLSGHEPPGPDSGKLCCHQTL